MKYKTYMRRVFGSRRPVWIGIDQGKGPLYRGNGVEMSWNLTSDSAVLEPRKGSYKILLDIEIGPVYSLFDALSGLVVCEGKNLVIVE